MKKPILISLLIAGGFIAGGYGLSLALGPSAQLSAPATQTSAGPAPVPTQSQTAASQPQTDATASPAPSSAVDPDASWNGADYAQVLAGTQIDGELKADANGNLILTLAVKDFFDYFLSAVGEVTPEQAIEQIRAQAKLRVPEPAATQAMELLADYITYQHMMQDFMQRPLVTADQQNYEYYAKTLRDSFEEIRALRRQVFSPGAVEAFFGLDEAYAEYAVASIQVKADVSLSEEEKTAKLQQLKTLLPEQMRIADIESRERAQAVSQAQELWQNGQNEAAARAALSKTFDEETIASTLDHFKRESAWQGKLDTYLTQRQEILESGLSDAAKDTQVEQLRQSMFQDADERMRAEAHERIEAENARLAALTGELESGTN